jgi:hypothetical protein
VGDLRTLGERLASAVDWPAILDGTDARYRVTDASTLPREYCRLGPG